MTLALLTGRRSHYSARHGAAAYISRSHRLVVSQSVCELRDVSSTDSFPSVIVSLLFESNLFLPSLLNEINCLEPSFKSTGLLQLCSS